MVPNGQTPVNICCLSPVSPLILFHHIHVFTYQGILFLAEGFFCPRGVLAEGVSVQGGFCPRWVMSKVGFVQGGLCPRGIFPKVLYVLGGFGEGGVGKGVLERVFFGKGGFGKGAYVLLPSTTY